MDRRGDVMKLGMIDLELELELKLELKTMDNE